MSDIVGLIGRGRGSSPRDGQWSGRDRLCPLMDPKRIITFLARLRLHPYSPGVLIDGVCADPLRAAASTYCPSLADPKGYMSCTRSGAHYDNRSPSAVTCIHGNARCCCRPSLRPRCLPSEGLAAAGKIGERRLVTQALYAEVLKPTRIGHSILHEV